MTPLRGTYGGEGSQNGRFHIKNQYVLHQINEGIIFVFFAVSGWGLTGTPKSKIWNPKSELQIPHPKAGIQNPESKTWSPTSGTQNPESTAGNPD